MSKNGRYYLVPKYNYFLHRHVTNTKYFIALFKQRFKGLFYYLNFIFAFLNLYKNNFTIKINVISQYAPVHKKQYSSKEIIDIKICSIAVIHILIPLYTKGTHFVLHTPYMINYLWWATNSLDIPTQWCMRQDSSYKALFSMLGLLGNKSLRLFYCLVSFKTHSFLSRM